jgi:hypothetical protein
VFAAVGIGLSLSVPAGSYGYCCCLNGSCANTPVLAALHIDPVSAAPAWPSSLALLSPPQAGTMEVPLAPVTVALQGALTAGALYRSVLHLLCNADVLTSVRHASCSVTVDVWSGPGLFTPNSTLFLTVAGQPDNSTTVTFSNLVLDRGGTYQLRVSTVVVLGNSTPSRMAIVSDPFVVAGDTARASPKSPPVG